MIINYELLISHFFQNVTVERVKSEEEALALLFRGESRRLTTTEAPYLGANCASGIMTIHFECLSLIRSNAFINRSEVTFLLSIYLVKFEKRYFTPTF